MTAPAEATDDALEALLDWAGAQDLITREVLSMLLGLGVVSGAWTQEHADAALAALAGKLRSIASRSATITARSVVLDGFAGHAERCRLRSGWPEPQNCSTWSGLGS